MIFGALPKHVFDVMLAGASVSIFAVSFGRMWGRAIVDRLFDLSLVARLDDNEQLFALRIVC